MKKYLQTTTTAIIPFTLVSILGILFSARPAQAQLATQPISPGDISREIESNRPSELPKLQVKPPRITGPSKPEPNAQLVQVKQWVFKGNEVLKNDELGALLQPFTGVDLSMRQIREAASLLQQAYEDAGWLARVDIPTQDISDGTVTLQIIEARLGVVRMDRGSTSLVEEERVLRFVQDKQEPGQVIHLPSLDRGLLLADDLNGVSILGNLQASTQPGATDVILNAAAEPPFTLDVSLDNSNPRAVGSERLSLVGAWISPAGFGESYNAQVFKSEGSDYVRLAANAPLGYSGLRGSISVSQLDYNIVTPDANGQTPDISGRSTSMGFDFQYPLLRGRQANIYATAGLDQRRYNSQFNGFRTSDYLVDGSQVGLVGNLFDSLWGGAANSYSLTWRQGQVKSEQVQVNNQVAGHFNKINWGATRQQTLSNELSFFASIRGQSTGSKPLDSSEHISLGGPSGVRAYPVGEASGPQGHILNLELRYRINPQWLVAPFYDRGRIEKRTADFNRDYSLEGTGISLSWSGPDDWSAEAIYAYRLGNNPNADRLTGKDQDGSLHKHRLWITVSRGF
jgi:hemolysin activation/secretion protein